MIKDSLKTIALSLIILSFIGVAHAWTEPTSNPPTDNVKSPITVSSDTQYKSGLFSTEYLRSYGTTLLATDGGNVGIGTTGPLGSKLNVITNGATASQAIIGATGTGLASLVLDASNGDGAGSDYFYMQQNNDLTVDIMTDANAGILSLGSKGNLDTLVIDGGNVGIGTTAPVNKLDVNGGINAQAFNSDSGNFIVGPAGGSARIWTRNTSPLAFLVNDGEVMRMTSDGNVGIGTTGPTNKLTVNSGGIELSGSAVFAGAGDGFYRPATNNISIVTAGSPRLTVDGSGNVGVGTTNPGAKLEVAGQMKITGGTPGANKVLTSDATGLASWTTPASAPVTSVFGRTGAVTAASGDYSVSQVTGAAPTASPTFTGSVTMPGTGVWNSSGDVGIGTTAPGYKLDVFNGSIRATKFYDYDSPSNYYVDPSADSSLRGLKLGGGTLLSTYFGTGGNDRLEIGVGDPYKRLGIGVTGWSGKESKVTIHNDQAPGVAPLFTPIDVNKYSLLVTRNSGGSVGIIDFAIDNTGKVGIGASTPLATLDVNGYMKLKPQTSAPVACSSTYKGSIAYASANNKLCVCNGTSWVYEGGAFNCGW